MAVTAEDFSVSMFTGNHLPYEIDHSILAGPVGKKVIGINLSHEAIGIGAELFKRRSQFVPGTDNPVRDPHDGKTLFDLGQVQYIEREHRSPGQYSPHQERRMGRYHKVGSGNIHPGIEIMSYRDGWEFLQGPVILQSLGGMQLEMESEMVEPALHA